MKNSKVFVLVFFLFFQIISFSQNRVIDSLELELKNNPQKDTVRVNILNYLAFHNYRNNPPQAEVYIEEALMLGDELQSLKFKAKSLYIKSIIYMEQAKFEVAIENNEQAIQIYESLGDLDNLAKCKNAFGILYYYKGNNELALKYYQESMRLKEEIGEENNEELLQNIGSIYSNTGEYQKALVNFEKALTINKELNDSYGILNCLNSIGSVYYKQGNYPLSLKYYNESLQVAENANDSIGMFRSLINTGSLYRMQNLNDKALNFYNKALAIKSAQHNIKNITALKNNIAGIYYDDGEFDTAIAYFKESIALSKDIGDDSNLVTALNGMGFIYTETDDYLTALGYFEEALSISLSNSFAFDLLDSYHGLTDVYYGLKKYDLALENAQKMANLSAEQELLRHEKNAYVLLSKIHEATGDYKRALDTHQYYKTLNDSLFNEENIEKITQLEYEYKYRQQLDSLSINELRLTKTIKTTSQDLEKTQRNYLWAIIGVLLLSILLGAIMFYQKLKNAKSKTQTAIMEQKLLRSQMTPHFIFNSLSVLQGMILNKEEKKSVNYLSKFSKLLRITLENSRDKTVLLSQELTAVQDYLTLQNLENEAYKCTILVEESIDVELFEIPPMLIQPFVENAIEHAFEDQILDRKIDIRMIYSDKKLICTIADNGVGINFKTQNSNNNKNSLATTITSERLKVLSKDFNMEGSVTIEDRSKFNEQGTIVTLVIPYKLIEN